MLFWVNTASMSGYHQPDTHRESRLIFSRQGWLIAIDMVGIGGKQRLQRRGLSPLREGHGVVRGRFIKPDKVQQGERVFPQSYPVWHPQATHSRW